MHDPSYRLKRAWTLIKMGYLTVDKKTIFDLIDHTKLSEPAKEPVLYLQFLVVKGIYFWYEGESEALKDILKSLEEFIEYNEPNITEESRFLWDLLKSEALLLKLRAYRFFIDTINKDKPLEGNEDTEKARYYYEGIYVIKILYNYTVHTIVIKYPKFIWKVHYLQMPKGSGTTIYYVYKRPMMLQGKWILLIIIPLW